MSVRLSGPMFVSLSYAVPCGIWGSVAVGSSVVIPCYPPEISTVTVSETTPVALMALRV